MKNFSMIVFVSWWLMAGCTKTTDVDFRMSVRDSQGQMIQDARVKINDEVIGTTGADGTLAVQLKLQRDARYRVEVSKVSSDFYFAPFYDGFAVASEEKLPLNLEAVLYAVPKPSPEEQAELEANQAVAEPAVAAATDPVVSTTTKTAEPDPVQQPPLSVADTDKVEETSPGTSTDIASPTPASIVSAADAPVIVTIHAFEGQQPLKDVSIAYVHAEQKLFEPACKTNERGRCVVRFASAPTTPVKFVARASGFQTQAQTEVVAHQGLLKFAMQRGASIEVISQTRTYNRIASIAGIGVEVNGRQVGVTDEFGHLLLPYRGKRADLVPIVLTSKKMLPAKYETDFVVSGPVQLVKHFTAKRPLPARVALLQMQTSGDIRNRQLYQPRDGSERLVNKSIKKFVILRGGFQEVAISSLRSVIRQDPVRITRALMRGWAGTKYSSQLDFVILPTLVVGDPMLLEVAVVGAHGQVVAAAADVVNQIKEPAAIDEAVATIAERLYDIFPFQAAIIAADKSDVAMNVGAAHRLGLKPGDGADVFGTQTDIDGRTQSQVKIARVKMKNVDKDRSVATLEKVEPRSAVQLGDTVIFRASRDPMPAASEVRVYGSLPNGRARSLAQANVYFGNAWLGATDVNGRLRIDRDAAQRGKNSLRIIKPGHRAFVKDADLSRDKRQEITVVKESAAVDLDEGLESLEAVLDEATGGDERVEEFAAACAAASLAGDPAQAQQRVRIQSFKAWFDMRNTQSAPLSEAVTLKAFYHLAYCQHRLWEASKDVVLLPNVVAAWRDLQETPFQTSDLAVAVLNPDMRKIAQQLAGDAETALNKVLSFRGN